jgi:hypothetical protein
MHAGGSLAVPAQLFVERGERLFEHRPMGGVARALEVGDRAGPGHDAERLVARAPPGPQA